MWKCNIQKMRENVKKIKRGICESKKFIVIILNMARFLLLLAFTYACIMNPKTTKWLIGLFVLRIMTINFLDSQMPRLFSLHFHIFWILHFHIFWIFELLYYPFFPSEFPSLDILKHWIKQLFNPLLQIFNVNVLIGKILECVM